MTRRLDYRDGVLKAYPEVYTPAALEALEILAPLNRDRRELMATRIARRLTRDARSAAHRFPRSPGADPAHGHPGSGRPRRQLRGERDPGRSEAPVDPGHRAGRQAASEHRERPAQRRLRAALRRRRLDVRWRGRARAGRYDVARQPAQPPARDLQRPTLPARRRRSRRRDEPVGARLLRASPSSTTGANSSTSPPRSSVLAVCTSTTATSARRTVPASPPRSSTSRSMW